MMKQSMTKKAWLREFARRLKARMKELDISQRDLAVRTDLQQSHICRLIRGKHAPCGFNIVKIANALDVEPAYLIDF